MRFGLISRGIRFTSLALAAAVAGSVMPIAGCMRGQSGAMYFATQGSGIAKTEPRNVKTFRRIRLDGEAKIRVTVGQPQQLTISGDDNILPLIDTTVDNDELRISSHESYSSRTSLEVTITVASLTGLDIRGSGDTVVNGLNGQSFDVAIRGSGNVRAQGHADAVRVEVKGSGDVNLTGLDSRSADVSVAGSGDVSVSASESLTASISGSGDVRYKGNPANVQKHIAGSGTVKRM